MLMYIAYPHEPILHNTVNYVHFLSLPDFTRTCPSTGAEGVFAMRSTHSTFEIDW